MAGFSVRGLVVSKKIPAASRRVFVVFKNFPRLRRGFIVVQRSVFLLQIFTVFALKKLKNFPPLHGGVLLFPKNFPPLRGGVLLFPGFSQKSWLRGYQVGGIFIVISLVLILSA